MPAAYAGPPIDLADDVAALDLPFYEGSTSAGRPSGFQSPAQDYTQRTPAQSLGLGEKAAKFTRSALRDPFIVWTKWQDARRASKQHRFYAVVIPPSGDLALGLVNGGLARIFGMKTATLPNGLPSKDYLATMRQMEGYAKGAKRGGWK